MTTNAKNQLIVLGSGTSVGIPMPRCQCEVCLSQNPKNNRQRISLYLQTKKNHHILIETSPDLRNQALQNSITNVDAVIITHEHADHTHGIDDLRVFCFNPSKTIPIYTHQKAANELVKKFPYIFDAHNQPDVKGGPVASVELHSIKADGTIEILDEEFTFFHMPHAHTQTLGFVHDGCAVIFDTEEIPAPALEMLKEKNLDLLIIDCLRHRKHNTHLSLAESLDYAEKIGAKRTGLIHMAHDFEHDQMANSLKSQYGEAIFPTYDGLSLEYL